MPSSAPVAENAQQDPHNPWSLTAVTAPFSRQSMLAGGYVFIIERTGFVFTLRPLYPDNLDLNSALLRSECLLIFKV